MTLSRDDAWRLLCEWTPSDSLRRHARAVEVVMRAAADRYGTDTDSAEWWGICGMLHDADYDRWPEEHPKRICAWLNARGHDDLAHAISAHYTHWGVSHDSPMDRALIACDELTGFIVACSYVRPEGIATLTPKSVKKKLKDKRFAATVERAEVQASMDILGVDPTEHIAFLIEALRPHAEELGIAGRG